MSQRLRDLGQLCRHHYDGHTRDTVYFQVEFIEKFLKLSREECLQFAKDNGYGSTTTGEGE